MSIPSLDQVKAMLQSTANTLQKNTPVKSVNGQTGEVAISPLPAVTAENNGAFLRVVDGAWATATIANAEEASF